MQDWLNAVSKTLIGAAVSLVAFAGTASAQNVNNYTTYWTNPDNTVSSSAMTFRQFRSGAFDGTYPVGQGKIGGFKIPEQRRWAGAWYQQSAAPRCQTAQFNTFFWGQLEFWDSNQPGQFQGRYNFCGQGPWYNWNGARN